MRQGRKEQRFFLKKRQLNLSATQIIAITFALIILMGTVLLSLPAASRSGQSCGVRPALFTATSATCVTGLVLYDTWTQWSGFGQTVILCLIEIGGLGFMSAASLFVFLFRRKVGLKQRMLMAQALSLNEMESVVKPQKWVIFGSLSVQFCGAVVLMFRFLPAYGFRQAAVWGIFHAISAFCNAGFDIFGSIEPGASISMFNSDPVIMITLMVLIIVSGLGFLVWEEIVRVRNFKKFSVYTKLVLLTTGALVMTGAVLFFVLEYHNDGTLGQMPLADKILNAMFQSVTLRTAGFAAIDQGALTEAGKAVSIIFMLIGGSSGSTAGGLKTVTFVVMVLFIWAKARGKRTVTVFHRTIPEDHLINASTIAMIMVALAVLGSIVICATSPVNFTDALYEAVSALATVGNTTGATGNLSIAAQFMVIVFMYFGRVGVLTISLGFLMSDRAEERFQYARTNLLIG